MQKVITSVLLASSLCMSVNAVENKVSIVDNALINQERIEYWLKKRGIITSNDNEAEKKNKINAYINQYKKNSYKTTKSARPYADTIKTNQYTQKSKLLAAQAAGNNEIQRANVLTILVDFSNLPHDSNGLEAGDTDLYYPQYLASHYNKLLYSTDGFDGPKNQKLMSVKQFYDQESGNSFDFGGSVYGWYRAKEEAAFYGGSNGDRNDKNVPALVAEAVNAAVADKSIDLTEFDRKDPYDRDNDGNLNEPDGYIDHVLLIHSSIGEEAGGGVLGKDAIWSHRFGVSNELATVKGSNVKIRNYTVVPIDAGAGVIAHEFGHDLGLIDEYDLKPNGAGSPVGSWSLMSNGSWLGQLRGTEPTSFSPLGREQLQTSLGGNWITQRVINANDLSAAPLNVAITQASNHGPEHNQIKVMLPPRKELFGKAKQGVYQLFSSHENNSKFRFQQTLTIPDKPQVNLSLWARWDIEKDYDYARFLINGQPLSNSFTKLSSPNIKGVTNLLTGKPAGSPWTQLVFDVSSYRNQQVTLAIDYITDPAVGGFGIVIDDIALNYDDTSTSVQNFEQALSSDAIAGYKAFSRINSYKDAAPDYYYLQLRSQTKLDKGLVSVNYDPGVVLWYRNESYTDNNSSEHPGAGFLSVVDADQQRLSFGNTERQIRDAAFSLNPQTPLAGDQHLTATSKFSDANNYTSPVQPQNGTKLPLWGIEFSITQQATDNNNATIILERTPVALAVDIESNREGLVVNFQPKITGSYQVASYQWDFGDGSPLSTSSSPAHQYQTLGDYQVTLTVTDTSGATATIVKTVQVNTAFTTTASFDINILEVAFKVEVGEGVAPYTYQWQFGDGESSNLQQPNHTYAKAGEYNVTVITSDASGQSKTDHLTVQVASSLSVEFTFTTTNETFTFNSEISGASGAQTITWDFGDGNSSTSASPKHVYAKAGRYNVRLTVTDASGTTRTTTKQVSVVETVKTEKPQQASSGGGSGGSLGIFGLLALVMFRLRRLPK